MLPSYPTYLHILKMPDAHSLIVITSSPLKSYEMDPLLFFDGQKDGMRLLARSAESDAALDAPSASSIRTFLRTPEGRGLAVVREDSIEAWHFHTDPAKSALQLKKLGHWGSADLVAVFDEGRRIIAYDRTNLTLTLLASDTSPSPDHNCSVFVPELVSLFCLPSSSFSESASSIIGVTASSLIVHVRISSRNSISPSMTVSHPSPLPLPHASNIKMILPVDPMAWSEHHNHGTEQWRTHDVLLSVAEDGELAFWSLVSNLVAGLDANKKETSENWVCTGLVKTGRTGYRIAKCSSAKKTALGES